MPLPAIPAVAAVAARLGLTGARMAKAAGAARSATAGVRAATAGREAGRAAAAMNRMRAAGEGIRARGLAGNARAAGQWGKEAITGVPGRISDHPVYAAAGISSIGFVGYDAFQEGASAPEGQYDSLREAVQDQARQRRYERAFDLDQQLFEKRASRAMMKLAAANPQMYNEVLTGRRLPRGAMVFGGRPRTDLLEVLAAQMAQGQYEVSDPQAELMRMLGGM